MLPAKVIGRVIATKKVEALTGLKLILLQPTNWKGEPERDYIVAADSVSAGYDEFVFYVEARDAAVAFPEVPPVDATIVGIIDGVHMPGV
ncbi:MAG TPA: EutN/CcmL family microcompartment protein [Candidatus Eremiobacteraeota bacterium]|nr:MAG: Carbon dioxide concentrating mechanism protein CcmL [bacterium ADurb.Bin363]HPZ09685.1 EutN/CcmL family microcompartment protein [Candidatus Eremiobacteraeota bacterium]